MNKEVFKGKYLALSIKITIVQLTLKSSTVILLADDPECLLKPSIKKTGHHLGVQLYYSTSLCQFPCTTKGFCFSRVGSWTLSSSTDEGLKEHGFQHSAIKVLEFARRRLSIYNVYSLRMSHLI